VTVSQILNLEGRLDMGCRGCKAKEAHIESLEKQLEFFREQMSPRPVRFPEVAPTSATDEKLPIMEELPWVSEEEEELMALKQAGLIDTNDMKRALEQVGALTNEIEFS
jgi:hypothetical protein